MDMGPLSMEVVNQLSANRGHYNCRRFLSLGCANWRKKGCSQSLHIVRNFEGVRRRSGWQQVICQTHRFDKLRSTATQRGAPTKVGVWFPLLSKTAVTIGMLSLVRLLYFIPVAGIDPALVPTSMTSLSGEQRMLQEMFLAGGSVPFNLATLGITPIVFSSMILSLLTSVPVVEIFPVIGPISRDLRQRQKMGTLTPEEVDRKVSIYSILMGGFMGYWKAKALAAFSSTPNFVMATVLDWLAALAITRYACMVIQDNGLGEGTGFLILALTLSGLGVRAGSMLSLLVNGSVAWWKAVLLSSLYILMVSACVWVTTAEVRIPTVSYSGGVVKREARMELTQEPMLSVPTHQSYLPLPLAQGGVTAIFLCSAWFWSFDAWLTSLVFPMWASFIQSWAMKLCLFGLGVFLTSLVPIGVSSPSTISEYLVTTNSGIKGVLPGEATIQHLKSRMFEARLWGGAALGIISSLSLWLDWQCRAWLGSPFGTLNLVLLVAVISAASRQVESMLEGPRLQQSMERDHKVMQMAKNPLTE